MCRWDESAVSILPEYLRKFYIKLLTNFEEFENSLTSNDKYRMTFVIEAVQLFSNKHVLYMLLMMVIFFFPREGLPVYVYKSYT